MDSLFLSHFFNLEMKELKEANALVEEFMLLANISVARQIYSRFSDTALLRRHPKPSIDNFKPLQAALNRFNIKLDVTSSKTLAESLDKAVVRISFISLSFPFLIIFHLILQFLFSFWIQPVIYYYPIFLIYIYIYYLILMF